MQLGMSALALDDVVGFNLHIMRVKRRVSLDNLALHLGLTPAELASIEEGKKRMSSAMLCKACVYLGTEPADLFRDDFGVPDQPHKDIQ